MLEKAMKNLGLTNVQIDTADNGKEACEKAHFLSLEVGF
jgi:hypothetical protein